jgi:asparagine synthase (glutamine-hydrolysing)
MCGIAAVFSSRNPVSNELLQKATLSLRHRGPDSQNVWVDPKGLAGLAHARLSLLDLSSGGNQPLSGEGERLKLVHNGEFYDFERIKRELESKGHRFRTASDSEILLPLYQELGTAALQELRGEFAFVLWDRNNRQVFAARDRFGIKPLFYAIHNGNLYFASEVKALFAMGVPAQWDQETFYQLQSTWLLPNNRTLYRNIFQVPPAHFLIASGDAGFMNPQLIPYWDFDYPLAEKTEGRKFDTEEEILILREKFTEAVRLRLRADVPVACYLSGGLDSCSVLGAAAKQVSAPVHGFTLSFPDDLDYDESAIAREMAEHSNSIYHEIPVRWHDLSDNFAEALWQAETPFINTHGVAKFLLSKGVRDAGFKAVLTGEGADEIFAGYVHFRKDYLNHHSGNGNREAQLARLADTNAVSRPIMLASGSSPSLVGLKRTLGFIPSFLEAYAQGAEASLVKFALFRDEFRKPFENRDSWRILLNEMDISRQLKGRSQLNQSLYLWSRTMLPAYLLTVLGDRMEMAHSIEGRLPFLDHKLVEHVVQLPIELKIQKDLTEKFILREAAKPFITDTVYRRQKHPFLAPPAAASPSSALFKLAQDTFRSKSFADNPFYDQTQVIALLDQVPHMDREAQSAVDPLIMFALSCTILQQKMGIDS